MPVSPSPSTRRPSTRRHFLATSAATVAAASLTKFSRAAAQNRSGIRVAVIGFNGRGNEHIKELKNSVVALCDVDEKVLHEKADQVDKQWNRKVDRFTDYRKLLERKDIDAVSIATPNHTHALLAIAAMQAGKDVYVEKPISHNIWEGRQMVAAARKYDRIVQCGTQSRSNESLQQAVEFIQSGQLGKIQYALGTCYKPRPSIGKLDKPLVIPSTLHYDAWCGPAEKRELFRSRVHYDWHWDFNTGNGDMGNQGIHQMDIARWFLGENTLAPRVISIGGRLGYEDAGDTPNTQIVYQDYAAAPLIFETRGLPRSKAGQKHWRESMDKFRGSGIGVLVQCEEGFAVVPSYREVQIYDNLGQLVKQWSNEQNSHHANWLEAVEARDQSKLNAEILEGHLSSSLCHTGAISHRLGEKKSAAEIADFIKADPLLSSSFDRMASHLRANDVDVDSDAGALTLGPWLEIDTATETFTNNDGATQLRSRQKQRAPYIVPEIESGPTVA
ncbi:MAG: Gfo/Idh/MocA family oxidoreductase, partial [Planctomycetes bacterium]|nr:Gfo/Idh/MocA family oxidoreductase [Planctomycetota bacterium]